MAIFDQFYPLVQQAERGYQNDHRDHGNQNSEGIFVGTNYGISAKLYEQALGHVPTESDMRAMTPETARQIIKEVYWDALIHGDQLNSQMVANTLGDMAVNSDHTALRLATERLWLAGLPVDPQAHYADLSPGAIAALNQLDAKQEALFLNAYREDRLDYYDSRDPHYDAFKNGWENRVNEHFPEQPVEGWKEVKVENQYFSPRALELVLFPDDPKEMDGVIGPHTLDALKAFQQEHALEPTGYVDPATRSLLQWEIMHDETAKALGDIQHSETALRDAKFEMQDMMAAPHTGVPDTVTYDLPSQLSDVPSAYSDHTTQGTSDNAVSAGVSDASTH